MSQSLLKHTCIDFIDGVGQGNCSITRRGSAVLLIAFIDHDHFAELPMVWCSSGELGSFEDFLSLLRRVLRSVEDVWGN